MPRLIDALPTVQECVDHFRRWPSRMDWLWNQIWSDLGLDFHCESPDEVRSALRLPEELTSWAEAITVALSREAALKFVESFWQEASTCSSLSAVVDAGGEINTDTMSPEEQALQLLLALRAQPKLKVAE